ncbi:uncharacterized protein NPIL_16481 [Nephila pilipes]|uniref:Uncharacterized protein n=1 Tax=Nephila pilipes TaxID=299642 RepID=A0A8X6U2K0_NEPPI|nr:uncharacterized protein NPIL_16481 [Nephila pilipes]
MKANRIFDRDLRMYFMCYSSNLHLDDAAEPDTWNFNSSPRRITNFINNFNLKMPPNESVSYLSPPGVLFSVHSPFIQDNPLTSYNELILGHIYKIKVNLEEEHLLPHPFPTNCTDYDELWRKNNKTGPRSQDVCRNNCLDSFKERCWDYPLAENDEGYTQDYSSCKKMDLEEIPNCEMNCKTDCLKLKYSFELKDMTKESEAQTESERNTIKIEAYLEKTEVNVMKHNPLYGTEELFSYIGGLMGCWLGMSVWASVGIFENAYRKIIQTKRLLRKE